MKDTLILIALILAIFFLIIVAETNAQTPESQVAVTVGVLPNASNTIIFNEETKEAEGNLFGSPFTFLRQDGYGFRVMLMHWKDQYVAVSPYGYGEGTSPLQAISIMLSK